MSHSQGLSNIPILSQINPILCIETYFFKIISNRLNYGPTSTLRVNKVFCTSKILEGLEKLLYVNVEIIVFNILREILA